MFTMNADIILRYRYEYHFGILIKDLHARKIPFGLKRKWKFFWQRHNRGWDDSDTWNLDKTFAKMILPRLIRFKELNNCVPMEFESNEDDWDLVLDKMIKTFSNIVSDDYDYLTTLGQHEESKEGLELFTKYYFNLWW